MAEPHDIPERARSLAGPEAGPEAAGPDAASTDAAGADTAPAQLTERLAHADTLVSSARETARGGGVLVGGDRAEDLIGACVGGRYRLLSLVGIGGMGAVYRARDDELDDIVALKLLRGDVVATAAAVELIRREVRLARRVTHRNVARIFEIGEHRGGRFITLEYVQGRALAAVLAEQGRLPPERCAAVMRDVCQGLQAIHDAGVIHGDVKPGNVLCADDGRAVITDFGIARAIASTGDAGGDPAGGAANGDGLHAAPVDDAVIGTPAYMAPELLAGGAVTPRSDIYALGVIAFEIATGDLPQLHIDAAHGRLGSGPPDPRELAPELPESVARAIAAALAREPGDRPASAREFGQIAVGTGRMRPAVFHVGRGPAPAARDAKHAIAVLPIERRGPDDDGYLAAGLTEDLIDRLSALARLRVLSRGATARLAGDPREPHEIGRALGVDTVIQGSVERAGGQLRVRVRAIDSRDGAQWWATRLDLAAHELLTASDAVARAVSARVEGVRAADGASGVRTADGAGAGGVRAADGAGTGEMAAVAAWPRAMPDEATLEAYLRARDAYRRFIEPAETLLLYERARERGAGSPLIEAGYAMALLRAWMLTPVADEELERRVTAAALRAERDAPHLGETQLACGMVSLHKGDPVGAMRGLRAAIALAPSTAEAHWLLGMLLSEIGHLSEAARRLDTATSLDPSMDAPNVDRCRVAALLGDWDTAYALCHSGPRSDTALGQVLAARVAAYRGDRDLLERVAERVASIPDDVYGMKPRVEALIAIFLGAGRAGDVYPLLRPPPGAPGGHSRRRLSLTQQLRAEIAGYAGDVDEAVDAIACGLDYGLVDLLWLECCPLLASTRADPRFDAVRDRIRDRAHAVYDAMFAPAPGEPGAR